MITAHTPPQFMQWLNKATEPFVERLPLLRMEKRCHLICAMHIDQPKHYPLSIACQLAHAQTLGALSEYLKSFTMTPDLLVKTFIKPWINDQSLAHELLGDTLVMSNSPDYNCVKSLLIRDSTGEMIPDTAIQVLPPVAQLMFWAISGHAQGLLQHVSLLNALSAAVSAPLLVLLLGKYMPSRLALRLSDEPAYYCIDPAAVEKHIQGLSFGEQRMVLGKPRTPTQIQACLKEYTGGYTELLYECYCTPKVC